VAGVKDPEIVLRRFAYNEPNEDFTENRVIEITDAEILDRYYPWWSSEMLRVHRSPKITVDNCIEDFIVVNWAWEVT
jgi:hypothetical protein